MEDVDLALEQGAHGLRGDLDVPVCAHVQDVDQPNAGQQLTVLGDGQAAAVDADHGSRLGHV